MAKTTRRLYAAYGSNMNLEQMALRCPTASVIGTTVMRNWRLLFCGVATIERSKGGNVPVLLWEIQPEDEAALDRYEGYPRMYRKESVRLRLNGQQVRAMVYIMNGERRLTPPSPGYYNTIRDGYIAAGLDQGVLREAAEMSKNRRKITMEPTIKEQILAVRDTGATNMFDVNAVQRIAFDNGFYELVNFIKDNRMAYARFILTGGTEEWFNDSEI